MSVCAMLALCTVGDADMTLGDATGEEDSVAAVGVSVCTIDAALSFLFSALDIGMVLEPFLEVMGGGRSAPVLMGDPGCDVALSACAATGSGDRLGDGENGDATGRTTFSLAALLVDLFLAAVGVATPRSAVTSRRTSSAVGLFSGAWAIILSMRSMTRA